MSVTGSFRLTVTGGFLPFAERLGVVFAGRVRVPGRDSVPLVIVNGVSTTVSGGTVSIARWVTAACPRAAPAVWAAAMAIGMKPSERTAKQARRMDLSDVMNRSFRRLSTPL